MAVIMGLGLLFYILWGFRCKPYTRAANYLALQEHVCVLFLGRGQATSWIRLLATFRTFSLGPMDLIDGFQSLAQDLELRNLGFEARKPEALNPSDS